MLEIFLAVLATGLGYTVLGLTGFGSALIIVPVLAWQWPLALVVPMVLLLDLPASLFHAGLNRRLVQWQEILRLLPGMALGMALGLWLSSRLSPHWPMLLLGLYVVWVGLRALWQARHPGVVPPERPAAWAHVFGLAIGTVEGLFGTAGPLVVAWLTGRLHDPLQLRATTPIVMTSAVLIVLGGMALEGRFNEGPILWRALGLLPVALGSVWLGHRLAHRIPAQRLRLLICALLVASGSTLAVRALGMA